MFLGVRYHKIPTMKWRILSRNCSESVDVLKFPRRRRTEPKGQQQSASGNFLYLCFITSIYLWEIENMAKFSIYLWELENTAKFLVHFSVYFLYKASIWAAFPTLLSRLHLAAFTCLVGYLLVKRIMVRREREQENMQQYVLVNNAETKDTTKIITGTKDHRGGVNHSLCSLLCLF